MTISRMASRGYSALFPLGPACDDVCLIDMLSYKLHGLRLSGCNGFFIFVFIIILPINIEIK